MANNPYVNKVQLADGTSLIDISSDTVTADKLMQGYTAHDRSGALITGTATGAEYTRTVVCPQQTVSSNSRVADLANFPDGFIAGDYYIVTYDGTEYLLTAETMWSSAQVVGDFHIYYEVPNEYLYPFAMGSSGNARDIAMLNTSQHTVKVEHLELITGGTTLTTKNITTNGTYNASSDSADGYSSVTVNVPSGTSKNAQVVQSTTRTNASTLTAIGAELTVSKTGTYDIYYSCFRTNTSSSYTWATRLYINGTAYGTAENTTWTNNQQNTHLSNISLTDGDKLRVYGRNTRSTSYYICAPILAIVEA